MTSLMRCFYFLVVELPSSVGDIFQHDHICFELTKVCMSTPLNFQKNSIMLCGYLF